METHLNGRCARGVCVEEADLLSLAGDDRQAAIDALGSGKEYPYVIVAGAVACAGALDIEAIAEAVDRAQPV